MAGHRLLLLGCLALLLPRQGHAEGLADRLSVRAVPDVEPSFADKGGLTLHLFADKNIEIPLRVEGKVNEAIDLRARLIQKSSTMGALIGEAIPILSDWKLPLSGQLETTFTFRLPAVQRESAFEFLYEAKAHAHKSWEPVGRTALFLYPKDLLRPLQEWSKKVFVKIDDATGKLRDFFASQGIEFLDGKASPLRGKRPVVNFVVLKSSSDPARQRARAGDESYIVFYDEVASLPKIVVRERHVTVEMKILDQLPSSPLAQKTLLEIVNLSNPPL